MLAKLFAAVLLPVATLGPDALGPDEVRLRDGRVLVGAVQRQGDDLIIATRDGDVRVARDDVEAIRTDAELRKALRELAKGRPEGAFTSLQLAQTAHSYGLARDMWKHLDRCVEQVGDDIESAVARQLRTMLGGLEAEILSPARRQSESDVKARGLLRSVRGSTGPAMRAAILELLVAEPGIDDELRRRTKIEPLPEQRLTALHALLRRNAAKNARLAAQRTVYDRDAEVRAGAVELIKAHGDPSATVQRLIPGLLHDNPAVRMQTAEAYAGLGDEAAIPVLVRAGPFAGVPKRKGNGGPGSRAHMFSTTSRSFIRDFDVEIAQAAAVANPIVSTVREGVVFDVNVHAVVRHRVPIANAYRTALKRLAGADPGPDPGRWAAWLAMRNSAGSQSER